MSKNTAADKKVHGNKWSAWLVIIISLAGIGICLYLYSLHVDLLKGEIKSGLLCGTANNEFGCHSVATSSHSSIFGLPLAAWGAIFYSTLALLGIGAIIFWRDCGQAFFRWALILAILGFAFDLYLAYTMIFEIGAICWPCTATYGINLVIIIILFKPVWVESKPRISLFAIFPGTKDATGTDLYYRNVIKGILIGGMLLVSTVGIAGSQFISSTLTGNDRERLAKVKENLLKQKPKYLKTDNRPTMGSDEAKLTVVEFSDFLCPYCAKASKYLKLAESVNHDTARFVFLHYPLDKTCNRRLTSNLHPGACMLAEGAACAHEQDKFWQYHDIAFETKGKISRSVVMQIASDLALDLDGFRNCLDSGRGLKVVFEDINTAANAGITGTPTLFINGRKLRGVPKPWILNEILQFSEKNIAAAE